jgi:hypothetical protein
MPFRLPMRAGSNKQESKQRSGRGAPGVGPRARNVTGRLRPQVDMAPGGRRRDPS